MSHAALLFDRMRTARREYKPRDHWPAPPARYQAAAVAASLLIIAAAALVP
jgi:hypothetical protein